MTDNRFRVVADHTYGPSIVHNGWLVDSCPDLHSAGRIAAALNALAYDGDLDWAIPEIAQLNLNEVPRVMRALAKMVRMAQR